jgi:hypothetical protein
MADYIMNRVALRAGAGGFAMKFSIVAIGKGIGTFEGIAFGVACECERALLEAPVSKARIDSTCSVHL